VHPYVLGAAIGSADHDDDRLVNEFELLDAGDGRRLERFGDRVVDRPAPGASDPPRRLSAWAAADLRFESGIGWNGAVEPWTIAIEGISFELRPTSSGQVGVFPEQIPNWQWLREHIKPGMEVLNLFAYTGASTLVSAMAGGRVVHVDATRPSVAWARRNAELSDLGARPIRWLVDDAEAFARREVRRAHRYDAIVLDPPSYGHGPRGAAWRLDERLAGLLEACQAVAKAQAVVLLTAHSEGIDSGWLDERLRKVFGDGGQIEAFELGLAATSGAHLWLGSCARMIRSA
jgi:23S rRNA (cytosine1962-C5)-methyltransferase